MFPCHEVGGTNKGDDIDVVDRQLQHTNRLPSIFIPQEQMPSSAVIFVEALAEAAVKCEARELQERIIFIRILMVCHRAR